MVLKKTLETARRSDQSILKEISPECSLEGLLYSLGFPGGSDGKEPACSAGDCDSIPGSGKFPGGVPIPVPFPGKFHVQRSLVGYSPWNHI